MGRNSKKSNRSGQAVLEYILLLSLVIVGVGVLVGKIRNGTDVFTARSGAKLEKMLRTGSAAPTLWNK